MTELVARALCHRYGSDPDAKMTEREAISLDEVGAPTWVAYVETARAEIMALRSAPPGMPEPGLTENAAPTDAELPDAVRDRTT